MARPQGKAARIFGAIFAAVVVVLVAGIVVGSLIWVAQQVWQAVL